MWQIKNLELKSAILDFNSSGQSKFAVSQLFSDGIQLVNVLELIDWGTEDTQVLICEGCGITECKSGDWVSFRRSGSLVLMLPANAYVWGNSEDKNEYRPPSYLKRQGIACLELSTYEDLRSRNSSVPTVDTIRPLTLRDAALLFHWNAPANVLGVPPEIRVNQDIVVGSSEGDQREQLDRLEKLLRTHYEDKSVAQLRPIAGNERVISLYLDAAEFIEWQALVSDGSEYRLLIDSKVILGYSQYRER